jgi:hypothetical protein
VHSEEVEGEGVAPPAPQNHRASSAWTGLLRSSIASSSRHLSAHTEQTQISKQLQAVTTAMEQQAAGLSQVAKDVSLLAPLLGLQDEMCAVDDLLLCSSALPSHPSLV